MAAGAETPNQIPQRAAGRMVAGLEVKTRRGRHVLLNNAHLRDQPVAVAVHGLDDFLRLVLQRFTQARDAAGEGRIGQDAAGPDRGQQFVLGHHLAGVAQQVAQNFNRLAVEIHGVAGDAQFERALIQHHVPELPQARGWRTDAACLF